MKRLEHSFKTMTDRLEEQDHLLRETRSDLQATNTSLQKTNARVSSLWDHALLSDTDAPPTVN